MFRRRLLELQQWLEQPKRKPLILRGARQVGKTYLVRLFSQKVDRNLIELNFEKKPQLASLFETNDPGQIILNLEASLDCTINAEHSILFLDEIQAVPELLAKLRWFAEEYPQLPVIAAGSLLEFVLNDHQFSMPVGRVSFMHLEPLCFDEFLLACGKQKLQTFIESYSIHEQIPQLIHEQLMTAFKEFIIVGGMPEVVADWTEHRSLENINRIQHDLLASYRDDFAKYSGRIAIERLDEVLMAVPKMLGEKFVYSRVNKHVPAATVRDALILLKQARVCHQIQYSHGNGVPLAAEVNEKFFKSILLDVGLASVNLGLNLQYVNSVDDINLINKGGLSEQVVGQLLRTINPGYIESKLYYWLREQKGSSAEIDYLLEYNNQVVPIEVKSGSTGGLKSLHGFMQQKDYHLAIRVNSDYPSITEMDVNTISGQAVQYRLLSIPFYLLGRIHSYI